MKKIILLSLIVIGFASCKNNTAKEQDTSQEKESVVITKKTSPLLLLGCYSYSGNNSVVNLDITDLDNGVTGKLTYALDGKDHSSGIFNGKLNEDKLFGVYTFSSEGIESKREIAFLIKDGKLVEGYGKLNEDGTAFTNKNDISYTSTMPLTKGDCKE